MTGLSVLTLVKNRARHLDRLIEGLDRSACRPLELIIVDMSDEPVDPGPRGGFPTMIVPLATEGLPLAAARNLAAERAQRLSRFQRRLGLGRGSQDAHRRGVELGPPGGW